MLIKLNEHINMYCLQTVYVIFTFIPSIPAVKMDCLRSCVFRKNIPETKILFDARKSWTNVAIMWWCQNFMTTWYEKGVMAQKYNSSCRLKLWWQVIFTRAWRQILCRFVDLDHVDQTYFREKPDRFTSRLQLNVVMTSKIKVGKATKLCRHTMLFHSKSV